MSWLSHGPAHYLFPTGLVLGCLIGAIGLLGTSDWWGIGLCVLFLGVVVAVGLGAEPVIRQRQASREVSRARQSTSSSIGTTLLVSTPESPPPAPRLVEDIPELLEMMELPGGTFWMGSATDDDQA